MISSESGLHTRQRLCLLDNFTFHNQWLSITKASHFPCGVWRLRPHLPTLPAVKANWHTHTHTNHSTWFSPQHLLFI